MIEMAKNVLQKHWDGSKWVELHPVTKSTNVYSPDGKTVEQKLQDAINFPKLFGLGADEVPVVTTDLNDLTKSGFYAVSRDAPNNPIRGTIEGQGHLIVLPKRNVDGGLEITQIFITTFGENIFMYVRSRATGEWLDWGSITSQTAGRTSKGYMSPEDKTKLDAIRSHIVETGSNENGTYIRWSDGTQICFGIKSIPIKTSPVNSIFHRDYIVSTFPAEFLYGTTTGFSISTQDPDIISVGGIAIMAGFTGTVWSYRAMSNESVQFNFIAIGRWK